MSGSQPNENAPLEAGTVKTGKKGYKGGQRSGKDGKDGKANGKGKSGEARPVWCFTCGGDHFVKDCPIEAEKRGKGGGGQGKGKGDSKKASFACFICGGGHLARECPEKGDSEKGKSKGKGKDSGCFICGGDHFARDCPEKGEESAEGKKGGKGERKGKDSGKSRQGANFGVEAVVGSEDQVCMLYMCGYCPLSSGSSCPRGKHIAPEDRGEDEPVSEDTVFVPVTRSKLKLIEGKWRDAGGCSQVHNAWQVKNKRLDFLYRATEHNMTKVHGKIPDCIEGWHGTAETNVFSIAINGFDSGRRSGQVFGVGEYFAKDPNVSMAYCDGGSFMFLCKLLLGVAGGEYDEDCDHRWIDSQKYYVINQKEGDVQVLPLFLLQFQHQQTSTPLQEKLEDLPRSTFGSMSSLATKQRGGTSACTARKDAGMVAETTQYLWLGWLDPSLAEMNDDDVFDDVAAFLDEFEALEIIPERNGARVGANVKLSRPINQSEFTKLSNRRYRTHYTISVDDQQPNNAKCRGQVCPRWKGPSKYCRSWNIKGHHKWNWTCSFDHPLDERPTHGATYYLEEMDWSGAKVDEIRSGFNNYFFDSSVGSGCASIINVYRIANEALEKMYKQRVAFLYEKQGFVVEKELWHGTHCGALPELLTHGLQPPSDTAAHPDCPLSGGKGLSTTLCNSSCEYCTESHCWNKCHMFGLGIYLADMPAKSHKYVRAPQEKDISKYLARVNQDARKALANKKPPPRNMIGLAIEDMKGNWMGVIVADIGNRYRTKTNATFLKQDQNTTWRLRRSAPPKSDKTKPDEKVIATAKCIVQPGVDYRNSPNPNDRLKIDVKFGDSVAVLETCITATTKWARTAKGWLPIDIQGKARLFEMDDVVDESPGSLAPASDQVYSMLVCRTCLGNPYMIDGNLLQKDAMHDLCWCNDPSDMLMSTSEEWNIAGGHDSYFVKGQNGFQADGLGVINNEFIVFHPYQVLPIYQVDYILT